jgi:hydrogenase maturation protease
MSRGSNPKILVIGIGNAYRRDDGVGLVAARRLKNQRSRRSFRVLEHSGEGADLMDCWEGADAVILIDAVRSGAKPGTLHRWNAGRRPLPARTFRGSSHAFSLVAAVELARVLRRLPAHLIVYGVEGQDFRAGTELSSETEEAVSDLVQRVLREVGQISRSRKSAITHISVPSSDQHGKLAGPVGSRRRAPPA